MLMAYTTRSSQTALACSVERKMIVLPTIQLVVVIHHRMDCRDENVRRFVARPDDGGAAPDSSSVFNMPEILESGISNKCCSSSRTKSGRGGRERNGLCSFSYLWEEYHMRATTNYIYDSVDTLPACSFTKC
jgi:hypothetical protein